MSTYNVPNISGDELAGLLNSYGGGYSMTPDGSGGYNVNADSASGIGAALGAGSTSSQSTTDPFLSALEGQSADTPSATIFGGQPQTQTDALTGPGQLGPNAFANGAFGKFLSTYGADAASIVAGVIILFAAVVKIV